MKTSREFYPRDHQGNIQYSNVHFTEVWKGFEAAVRQGLTKSIGVSNFNKKQITTLLQNADIKPVVNQVLTN